MQAIDQSAIPWWRSPAIWGARVAAVLGAVLFLAQTFGWLTPEQAGQVDAEAVGQWVEQVAYGLIVAGGIVSEWGRRNGGKPASPIK